MSSKNLGVKLVEKPKFVYVAYEDDKYELPFAIGDSLKELAEEIGVQTWDVYNCIKNRGRSTTPFNQRYRVEKVRLASDIEDMREMGINITVNVYV